jgi:AcrR family transcriptional regulator
MKGDDTRSAIKLAAQRLFATRGIDGVSVREIATAANQRNSGSVHYYFGTKEALVAELIVDGAQVVDERRNQMLDALESRGGLSDLRAVIEVLVRSSTDLTTPSGEEDTYLRFINWLQMNHRALFLGALENKWNSGYQRSLSCIKALLPGLPEPVLNQRLVFMGLYLNATLSAREAAIDGRKGEHPFWSAPHTIDNLIDTIHAMLEGKPSAGTMAHLSMELAFADA